MTGCKGLTVRATIVAGVDDHVVPRPDGDPDEERRLLYVTMTRATRYVGQFPGRTDGSRGAIRPRDAPAVQIPGRRADRPGGR